ncbi:hypothetical protein FRC0061_00747 [Corynebacterium diphtheriae]|nr:hypothetical protein FRC0061_00747 [Corynebacterium diphtheriae]
MVVGANLVAGHDLSEVRYVNAVTHGIDDALDVAGTQVVVLTLLNKALRGVDEQHVIVVALLLEHHDDCRDTGAVEDVGRQANDGVDVVGLDEIAADVGLRAATEQHAVRQDDGKDAVGLDVEQLMQQEGVVGLGLGR